MSKKHSSFSLGIEMSKKSIAEIVEELLRPTVEELGYELWDVEYSKIGTEYHLELTIDSDEGINIEDCEKVHRAIDPILDEVDPIENFYYLEVSSPGIERELRTDEHINLSLGQKVEAKLFKPIDGKRSIVGELVSYDGERVCIDEGGEQRLIAKNEIAKITTVYFE